MTHNISRRDRPGGGEDDPQRERAANLPPSEEECRSALRAVLDSNTLSSSRRIRDFIAYAGQAFLEGREDLDQYEIADRVLQRQSEFNPLEDASVRKLASQTRHKLEEFYSDEGLAEPVIALLPSRSYVLRFRYRKESQEAAPTDASQETLVASTRPEGPVAAEGLAPPATQTRAWRRFAPYLAGALVGAAPFLAMFLWQSAGERERPKRSGTAGGGISIMTKRGDLRGPLNEIAAGAVRLGPIVGPMDEVTASMRFEPSKPTQQAGIMLFGDPDHFVRLGYQFKMRTMIEMGVERQGKYLEPLVTYEFDPLTLRSPFCWLTLRRNGGRLQGFISRDGFDWRPAGGTIEDEGLLASLRAAVYAFDGRTENPSAEALFRNFGVGVSFHNRPEGVLELQNWAPEWSVRTDCSNGVEARIVRSALEVVYRQESANCSWEMMKSAPEGDWSFSTVLDFMPVSGGSAGLVVTGERGKLTMSRRALSGGSILLEQPGDEDFRVEDFPGWPMITLRLVSSHGRVSASFSRDGERFIKMPGEVSLDRIGKPVKIGIVTMEPKWGSRQNSSPARFYRIQQDIDSAVPFR
jgi:hypothetical protein